MPLGTLISVVAPLAAKAIQKAFSSGDGRRSTPLPPNLGVGLPPGFRPAAFTPGSLFRTGPNIEIVTESDFRVDPATGQLVARKKRRRRRRRLLTCGDKADIAFLTGTLGKGSLASTAISAVLARCS